MVAVLAGRLRPIQASPRTLPLTAARLSIRPFVDSGGNMRAQLIVAAVCGTFVINLPLTGFPQTEAFAATQLERGSYLVNTIMVCGNCHSPRDAQV